MLGPSRGYFTIGYDFIDLFFLVESDISDRGESEYGHEDTGYSVDAGHGDGVVENLIIVLVVAGERDDRTER